MCVCVHAHACGDACSEGLAESSTHFRASSRLLAKKMWWQQCRVKIIIAGIVFTILAIVISELQFSLLPSSIPPFSIVQLLLQQTNKQTNQAVGDVLVIDLARLILRARINKA